MVLETWLVVTVAGAFLLLGIVASPLAWVALLNRRSRAEQHAERRFLQIEGQLRALMDRAQRNEPSRPIRVAAARGWPGFPRKDMAAGDGPTGPELIAVPNLASTTNDREATIGGLSQRYAAIWSLAGSGASADVIARATGQPIGQIELILGLRRQIDEARTTTPHARHE